MLRRLPSLVRSAPRRLFCSDGSLPALQESLQKNKTITQATSKAFLPSEMPAVVDLFDDFAGESKMLDREGLRRILNAVGEKPSSQQLEELFIMADADSSGEIDLDELCNRLHPEKPPAANISALALPWKRFATFQQLKFLLWPRAMKQT